LTVLTPLLYYILFAVLVWLILNYAFKKNEAIQRVKRWIIGLSIGLFIPLTVFYFIYIFGTAFENHYDVRKGTLLWYATMDNRTITQFPVLNPAENVTYNSIGGDSPEIGTGWEIEYLSQEENQRIESTILEHLTKEGFDIKKVDELQYYGAGFKKNSNTTKLYSGSKENGESLDLSIEKVDNLTTRIECSIII
jgi:hypothetical protein